MTRNDTVGIYKGPLLYAADIKIASSSHQPLNWTDRTPLDASETDPRARDYALEPTSPWKFAIDLSTLAVKYETPWKQKLANPLFTSEHAPSRLEVSAYPIDWPVQSDTAGLPPTKPAFNASDVTRLELIPYGAAKLHIAQFPAVGQDKGEGQ